MLFIFDMGGVVTTTAGDDIFEGISKRLGISKERFFELSGKGTPESLFKKMDKGIIESKEYWAEISEKLGEKIKTDWFRLLFHPVLNEDTVRLIKELKAKGHRVVCGTNTIESHYDNHLSRGDYSYFDMTYASIHMGVAKPNPEFWKMILEAEGYSAQEAFFTDDKQENVDAAASLGITAYLFDRAKGFEEFLRGKKVL